MNIMYRKCVCVELRFCVRAKRMDELLYIKYCIYGKYGRQVIVAIECSAVEYISAWVKSFWYINGDYRYVWLYRVFFLLLKLKEHYI